MSYAAEQKWDDFTAWLMILLALCLLGLSQTACTFNGNLLCSRSAAVQESEGTEAVSEMKGGGSPQLEIPVK
jgi:hypothetical protein